METAGLIFNTFIALFSALSFFIVFFSAFVYALYCAWILLPSKKVVVYTRDKDGKAVKIKVDERAADLLWGDKK